MNTPQNPTRRGYTLIEILLCVGVLGLLLALTLPSLAASRAKARQSACAAQMASHLQVMHAYAADARDAWPYPPIIEQDEMLAVTFEPYAPVTMGVNPPPRYELLTGLWHLPVLSAYADRLEHRSLICPSDAISLEAARGAAPRTSTIGYRLSTALLVTPEALSSDAADLTSPSRWIGQRVSSVLFPSSKAALRELVSHRAGHEGRDALGAPPFLVNVAAADASVAQRSTARANLGLLTTEELIRSPNLRSVLAHGYTFSRTPMGVRGRDW